ncbi:MAG: FAD/NAD(P)-binding oxidoreductase [Hyphomicrobium sp.]|nr:FAD/NAD(P)-binding oxidoreductase [Hyphomicrobium sp.]
MTSEPVVECEVAVIGGGPAGLAAATRLKEFGVARVLVIERESEPGGIPRHCDHYAFGFREFGRVLKGPDYARRLVDRATGIGVGFLTMTTVVAVERGPRLRLSTPEGTATLKAKRVLIATGTRERSRAQRMIGGSKPGGVLSTGALQALVHLKGMRPFRRPVVVGTELVSFSALLTCRHAGITPVAMIEPGPRILAWTGSGLLPRVLGIPLHLSTQVARIFGTRRVEAVEILDRDGHSRTIDADGLLVTGDFVPECPIVRDSHLAIDPATGGPHVDQHLRLTDPAYFAAGNVLRPVETAGWCWREGIAAARAIYESLADTAPRSESSVALRVAGPDVKYAVPQRITRSSIRAGLDRIQFRVTRPMRGTITVVQDGRTIATHRLRALPERRITLPLDWRGVTGSGDVVVSFVEGR